MLAHRRTLWSKTVPLKPAPDWWFEIRKSKLLSFEDEFLQTGPDGTAAEAKNSKLVIILRSVHVDPAKVAWSLGKWGKTESLASQGAAAEMVLEN